MFQVNQKLDSLVRFFRETPGSESRLLKFDSVGRREGKSGSSLLCSVPESKKLDLYVVSDG